MKSSVQRKSGAPKITSGRKATGTVAGFGVLTMSKRAEKWAAESRQKEEANAIVRGDTFRAVWTWRGAQTSSHCSMRVR